MSQATGKVVNRPVVTMYSQAGVAELEESSGPFISVQDAQDMAAWCRAYERAALTSPSTARPIRGVRVEGDTVVIAVTGGNDAARLLCSELVLMIEARTRET